MRIGLVAPTIHAAVLAASLAPSVALQAQDTYYAGWAQYSTGRYQFERSTSSLYIANGFGVTAWRVRATASIPFIVQSGGRIQYGGSGIVPTGGMPGHDSTSNMMTSGMNGGMMGVGGGFQDMHVGFGDPVLRGDVILRRAGAGPGLFALTGAVKPAIASVNSGFGTGRWDYAAGATVTSARQGVLWSADVAYWLLGDVPGLAFRNPLAYAVSAGRVNRSGRYGFLTSVSGTTPILNGVPGAVTVSGGATYHASPSGLLSITASAGITSSAPAMTLAVGWRRQID